MNRNRGFSLVEIAMVVAIALILLSLGLTAINSQLSSAAYSITKKRQDVIKDALANYLGARRSFPCPYVPIAGTAATGIAPPQTGAPLSCPSFRTVPYVTLGLAREAAEELVFVSEVGVERGAVDRRAIREILDGDGVEVFFGE